MPIAVDPTTGEPIGGYDPITGAMPNESPLPADTPDLPGGESKP